MSNRLVPDECVAGFPLGSRKDRAHAEDGWTSGRDNCPPLRKMPPRGTLRTNLDEESR